MHMYCACGYPFLLGIVRDGTDYYLILRDGKCGPHSLPIVYCPQCGRGLVLEELAQHTATIVDWHRLPEAVPGSAMQSTE